MVSIVIVNYNTYAYTEDCIKSIYAKTLNTKFEIILVSNSSSDRKISDILHTFPEVKIIENPINLGFAKANNVGISTASGETILLLNSDTVLLNDAINICQNILDTYNHIGVVSSQLQYDDGELQPACQSFPSITGEVLELTRLHKLFSKSFIAKKYINSWLNLSESTYCDWVWGTFFMFRKTDLIKLEEQKLSEQFFMYGEDMEWCYQFYLAKLKSYYCAEAKVIHHLGKSGFGNSWEKSRTITRNELQFLKKYKGLLFTIAIRIIKFIKFSIQGLKDKSNFRIALNYLTLK